jgi:hypothetical protein
VYDVPTKESISNYRGQLPDRSGDAWSDVNWVTDHLHGNFENSGPVWPGNAWTDVNRVTEHLQGNDVNSKTGNAKFKRHINTHSKMAHHS